MRPAPPRPDEKTPAPFLPTVTCHMIIPDQTGTLLLYYIIVILYITSPGAALLCASILHPHALSAAPSHAREAARYIYIWLRQGPPAPSAAGASSLQPPPPPPPPQPQPRQQQQQSQFSLTQDLPLNLLLPSKGLQYQMPTVPDASIIPQPAQIINLVDPQQQEKLKEILLIQNIELLRLREELMQHQTLKQGQSIQLQNLNASER